MNIFRVDDCPTMAGRMLCDSHTVKMVLETAQLLSSAMTELTEPKHKDLFYKPTHMNHPCSLWVRDHPANFMWTVLHGLSLSDEYERRYGRRHKSYSVISWAPIFAGAVKYTYKGLEVPKCMPDEVKVDCPVQSYRNYYNEIKSKSMKMRWKMDNVPEWYTGNTL